jgi:hypothetical protein
MHPESLIKEAIAIALVVDIIESRAFAESTSSMSVFLLYGIARRNIYQGGAN